MGYNIPACRSWRVVLEGSHVPDSTSVAVPCHYQVQNSPPRCMAKYTRGSLLTPVPVYPCFAAGLEQVLRGLAGQGQLLCRVLQQVQRRQQQQLAIE